MHEWLLRKGREEDIDENFTSELIDVRKEDPQEQSNPSKASNPSFSLLDNRSIDDTDEGCGGQIPINKTDWAQH